MKIVAGAGWAQMDGAPLQTIDATDRVQLDGMLMQAVNRMGGVQAYGHPHLFDAVGHTGWCLSPSAGESLGT